jgi:hypothetical protein
MATLDCSQCPVVESIPGKLSGAWVLKGTRMPISALFENLDAGANLQDIMQWFDATGSRTGEGASLNLPSSSILPKPLEPFGRQLGVAHGVRDVTVAQVLLY